MISIQKLHFKKIDSTNNYAKENISKLSLPALIISDEQTAGRGRRGNSFFSPKDTGLYMTLVFKEKSNSEMLTPAAAVAVCEALSDIGLKPGIKWVNDIFINGKKVCGILTERYLHNGEVYIILGIGINITTSVFPDNLPYAGNIGVSCDKYELADTISDRILGYANNTYEALITEKYRNFLFIIGKEISYSKNNILFRATVKDINEKCNLIVTLPDGDNDILSSGEISIII